MMLRGFRSRCTMPAAWATARPSAIWLAISITRRGLQPLPLERAVERLPGDQLHHDVGPAVEFADVVDRDDVRVVEQGRQPGLALQALRRGAVGGQFVGDELDGDGPAQARVARLIDLSHAAGSERTDDLVHADTLARIQAHLGMAQDTPIARRVLEHDGPVPPGINACLIRSPVGGTSPFGRGPVVLDARQWSETTERQQPFSVLSPQMASG